MQTRAEKQKQKENLIERLAAYRIKERLTYKAIADDMDVPLRTVAAWINGDNLPSDIGVSIIEEYLNKKENGV